jgi:hypothetical protein
MTTDGHFYQFLVSDSSVPVPSRRQTRKMEPPCELLIGDNAIFVISWQVSGGLLSGTTKLMSDIFLVNEGGELVPLSQQAYDSEDLLQTLLADYPDLLAGDQINSKVPRRWLLVKREAGVPGEEQGAGRWSLDHLFLDQDGIPTLVEVKRSTDTRIRREVVGQMLDYAANGVKYWPVETLRAHFEQGCEEMGVSPSIRIAQVAGHDREDEYWVTVKTNLQAGRIRMLFVADAIPDELRRVVEFLNEQMDPAEVLAVEIKQYANVAIKTLVPRVIGQTVEAEDRKRAGKSRTKRTWNEKSYLDLLHSRGHHEFVATTEKLIQWAKKRGLRIAWGGGEKNGSFYAMYDLANINHYTFACFANNEGAVPYIEIPFQDWEKRPPFDQFDKRQEFAAKLERIPGVSFRETELSRYPRIPLTLLGNEDNLDRFLEAFDWEITEIQRHFV